MQYADILFIRGDERFHKSEYLENRPYWSAQFPVVLEKHGFLSVDQAGPDALADLKLLSNYSIVIVAHLPDKWWTQAKIENLVKSGIAVFLEGPLPKIVTKALGVNADEVAFKEGVLKFEDIFVENLANRYGLGVSGQLSENSYMALSSRTVGLKEWALCEDVGITLRQAAEWSLTPWRYSVWSIKDSSANQLVSLTLGKGAIFPAVIRKNNVYASAFEILSTLVWHHTAEPSPVNTHRIPNPVNGIEGMMLGIIDDMHLKAGRKRRRIMPWPLGVDWVVNVRHDYDRDLKPEQLDRVLETHRKVGSKATVYWREIRVDPSTMKRFINEGHEVGLHTEKVWYGGEKELKAVEDGAGVKVLGAAAHGASDSFRFQGAPNILWSEKVGFRYTEATSRGNYHPYFFVNLNSEGVVERRDIVCLPKHVSLDNSFFQGTGTAFPAADIEKHRQYFINCGGLFQLMNHPDVNPVPLLDSLMSIPKERVRFWTAADAAKWWNETHNSANFKFWVNHQTGSVDFTSPGGTESVVLESLDVNGSLFYESLGSESSPKEVLQLKEPFRQDIASYLPQSHILVQTSSTPPEHTDPVSWDSLKEIYKKNLREYYLSKRVDPDKSKIQATIHFNTEAVQERISIIRSLSSPFLASNTDQFKDKDVLEIGSGLGALSLYLASAGMAHSVSGIDIRYDFVDLASKTAEDAGVSGSVRFNRMDMRDMSVLPDAAFDTVLCCNSLYCVRRGDELLKTLSACRRVLRPGGSIIIYQANRWRIKNPVTQKPLLHLLPASLESSLISLRKKKNSSEIVELVSPSAMARALKHAGFSEVCFSGNRGGRPDTGFSGVFLKYFSASGRVPQD